MRAWEEEPGSLITETRLTPLSGGEVRRSRLAHVNAKHPWLQIDDVLAAGAPPGVRGRDRVAMAADHLVVQAKPGLSETAFRQALAGLGLTVGRSVGREGLYLVDLPQPALDAVQRAAEDLSRHPELVAYAEPDYVISAYDDPEVSAYEQGAFQDEQGVVWYPEAQLSSEVADFWTPGPLLSPEDQAAEQAQRLAEIPAGGRVLTLDAPFFPEGPGNYAPRLQEQNISVEMADGIYVQNAYNAGYANNGSYYGRKIHGNAVLRFRHRENIPFTAVSIDLAEYSTLFASPTAITFVGTKTNGTQVQQTFLTDGTMDGTGPAADFQTFNFSNTFQGLTKLEQTGAVFMFDNMALIVEGQETPLPPPPPAPLIYQVTWSEPEHPLDGVTDVSGPYAPANINFGAPKIRAAVGPLTARPLSFVHGTSAYEQIEFVLHRAATRYRVDFDLVVLANCGMAVFLDGSSLRRLDFTSTGLSLFQSQPYLSRSITSVTTGRLYRCSLDANVASNVWSVLLNDTVVYTGALDIAVNDITGLRFSLSAGAAAIDNVFVSAWDVSNSVPTGPLVVTAPATLNLGETYLDRSREDSVIVRNVGDGVLVISNVAVAGSGFSSTFVSPQALLPGGYALIPVVFAPTAVGSHTGLLTITSNAANLPIVTVPLSGVGLGWPDIDVHPDNLRVSMQPNTTGSKTFTIRNRGESDLRWHFVENWTNTATASTNRLLPNDPMFGQQWALRDPLTQGPGISATRAWAISAGNTGLVVAVVDTGLDDTHPDIATNVYRNPAEIAGNGVDDDANGYVDDVRGWDFVNHDNSPLDGHGHGTHVSGIIAAHGSNAVGIAGVAWRARIMPLKILSDSGFGFTADATEAIEYARRMGVRLSNNSWGGSGYSTALRDAILHFEQDGGIFVAAAGNSGLDLDVTPQYPAGYDLDGIVSVAATDAQDILASFSNYGHNRVDLAAPGVSILSLVPGAGYGIKSGTSMAAPHVTGVLLLMLARNPAYTSAELKNILLMTVDSIGALHPYTVSGGRLNAARALLAVPPAWVQPGIHAGVIAPDGEQVVPLSLSSMSLTSGWYYTTLLIDCNDPDEPQVPVDIALHVLRNSAFTEWQVDEFGLNNFLFHDEEAAQWGAAADPNINGWNNALEFYLGLDPSASNMNPISFGLDAKGRPQLSFARRADTTGITAWTEWTDNLLGGTWHAENLLSVADQAGATGTPPLIRQTITLTNAAPTSAHFRLVGTQDP